VFSLEKYKERIVEEYKKRGFFDVKVSYEFKDGRVVVRINEGKRYRANLRVDGEFYSFPYDRNKIEEMVRKKVELLKETGYLDATYDYEEEVDRKNKVVKGRDV